MGRVLAHSSTVTFGLFPGHSRYSVLARPPVSNHSKKKKTDIYSDKSLPVCKNCAPGPLQSSRSASSAAGCLRPSRCALLVAALRGGGHGSAPARVEHRVRSKSSKTKQSPPAGRLAVSPVVVFILPVYKIRFLKDCGEFQRTRAQVARRSKQHYYRSSQSQRDSCLRHTPQKTFIEFSIASLVSLDVGRDRAARRV